VKKGGETHGEGWLKKYEEGGRKEKIQTKTTGGLGKKEKIIRLLKKELDQKKGNNNTLSQPRKNNQPLQENRNNKEGGLQIKAS